MKFYTAGKYVITTCLWCGKEFDAVIYKVTAGGAKCCSQSCSAKYGNSLRPKAESRSRLRAISREIYIKRHGEPICQRCGSAPADVHHINENPLDNDDNNHKPLCRSCHTTEHNLERV